MVIVSADPLTDVVVGNASTFVATSIAIEDFMN